MGQIVSSAPSELLLAGLSSLGIELFSLLAPNQAVLPDCGRIAGTVLPRA